MCDRFSRRAGRQERVNYYFDENFAPMLARAIRSLHSRDHQDDGIDSWADRNLGGYKDEPWINELINTQLDWVILTMDLMRHERHAVQGSGFTWFIFAKGWAIFNFGKKLGN